MYETQCPTCGQTTFAYTQRSGTIEEQITRIMMPAVERVFIDQGVAETSSDEFADFIRDGIKHITNMCADLMAEVHKEMYNVSMPINDKIRPYVTEDSSD